MLKRILLCNFLLLLVFNGCKSSKVPENLIPASNPVWISYDSLGDTLRINLENRIKAPVRITIGADDDLWKVRLQKLNLNFLVLEAEQDTILVIDSDSREVPKLEFKAALGDPERKIIFSKIALPIPENKAVQIVQGYNGSYSHFKATSKFAIDFELNVGDTIFAAYEGFAVQVREGYTKGGNDIKLLDHANNIIIYNPQTGLFFQYSHLAFQGALVEVGEWVKQGQPIGISGMTGYTDIPHLHFNVLAPDPRELRLISVPVDFIEGYSGKDLRKNEIIKK